VIVGLMRKVSCAALESEGAQPHLHATNSMGIQDPVRSGIAPRTRTHLIAEGTRAAWAQYSDESEQRPPVWDSQFKLGNSDVIPRYIMLVCRLASGRRAALSCQVVPVLSW